MGVKLLYGTPGAGKVLTSDATGVATWQVVPATDAGTFDGGNASTVWTGQPKIDAGAAS